MVVAEVARLLNHWIEENNLFAIVIVFSPEMFASNSMSRTLAAEYLRSSSCVLIEIRQDRNDKVSLLSTV